MMKISFRTDNPNEIWPLLGKVVTDKNVLSDAKTNLRNTLIMPFNLYAMPDGSFLGALYFKLISIRYRTRYDTVSIAELVERIRRPMGIIAVRAEQIQNSKDLERIKHNLANVVKNGHTLVVLYPFSHKHISRRFEELTELQKWLQFREILYSHLEQEPEWEEILDVR